MRFRFDLEKSNLLREKRGIGFEEAITLFEGPYYLALKKDEWPEQWLAVGWVNANLYSLIYEERDDELGVYFHLATLWKSTAEEKRLYENAN